MSAHRRFLIAIETDATRYHGDNASRPQLLGESGSNQLLAHVTTDLEALMPEFSHHRLATAGALFDQTQVLRPHYPVFSALEAMMDQSTPDGRPMRIAAAAENGRMPDSNLQPSKAIPLGLLQILPMVVSGEPGALARLGDAMEHQFLESGQVSAHTARWLESAFAIKINHARFMTLMDLAAMFRLQLEHFGFLELWRLVDAALNNLQQPFEVDMGQGQQYRWQDGAVHVNYQTFDYWSRKGGGKGMDSYRGKLAGGYADWTRLHRQVLTTLKAHAVPMEFTLPERPDEPLTGTFFVERSNRKATSRCAGVTEHSFAELGTICISVSSNSEQENYYPLEPQGLNDIHAAIRSKGLAGRTVAFPGTILFDEKSRVLICEPVSGKLRH